MVAFADAPARKEVTDTISGVAVILDAQKDFLTRQCLQRGIVLTSNELALLEIELNGLIIKQVLISAGLGKTGGGTIQ